ncbi:MAG: SDR family oxidoreductase [Deltaproteobacteria bacterium]|nr:SDR family oxidoreductase [Deltaproteobacteria bacterium]
MSIIADECQAGPSLTRDAQPAYAGRVPRLAGETVLITGSTSGIGRQAAITCAREGALVAVHGRNAERGAAVVQTIGEAGGQAEFFAADLAEEAACDALVAGVVARFGGLTVLVNNAAAASGGRTPIGAFDTALWERILRVNLTSPAWLCRAAIPHMLAAGHGSIVNVSSRQAERASPGLAPYATSKGGLNALTRSIAVDYGRQNIRCNALSVGYVENPRRDADMSAERRAELEGMHLTRLGRAEDIAWAIVYLASRESEFVTGALLPVDGGGTVARGKLLG